MYILYKLHTYTYICMIMSRAHTVTHTHAQTSHKHTTHKSQNFYICTCIYVPYVHTHIHASHTCTNTDIHTHTHTCACIISLPLREVNEWCNGFNEFVITFFLWELNHRARCINSMRGLVLQLLTERNPMVISGFPCLHKGRGRALSCFRKWQLEEREW